MYTLYISNKNYSSWSLRPWILMRQLNIPFTEQLVPFGSDPGGGNGFRRFSPTGKVPCLVDGAIRVWDSLAIVEYLADEHAQVWPAERAARAWARSASAEMHSGFHMMRERCSMNLGLRVRITDTPPQLSKELARIDELWSSGLATFGGPFLAGAAFTAVDAFFAPVAFRFLTYGVELSDAALRYAERLRVLPGMREWYASALQEPWRDAEHEEEARRSGERLADLRHM